MVTLASLTHEGNERSPAATPVNWPETAPHGGLDPDWDASCNEPESGHGLGALLRTAALWRHRSRTRRELEQLDDRLLRALGLEPFEARVEARKPFGRAEPVSAASAASSAVAASSQAASAALMSWSSAASFLPASLIFALSPA